MIDEKKFVDTLQAEGVEFFTGVPDSFLNQFCNYLLEKMPANRHVIAANEGNAVALASGYYFSTGTVPLVYMQNSGMGNAYNPLVSLVDRYVYQVPMVLLIGWRGKPGTELKHPQHKRQGETTTGLLELMDIPYVIASDKDDELREQTQWAVRTAKAQGHPVAIIGCKGVFGGGDKENVKDSIYPLSREEAIEVILDTMPSDTVYTATTGRATRELYFLRQRRGEDHEHDFLNLGSMGHASSVAQGIALAQPQRPVVALDGDCAAMMHLGALTVIPKLHVPNLIHVILNNGAHESVGGQPSAGHMVNLTQMAQGAGYATVGKPVTTREELVEAITTLRGENKPGFLDVWIHRGLRGELPALDIDAPELIAGLMAQLRTGCPEEGR